MKVIAWNLNHRSKRRRIPFWVSDAIATAAANVLVITEYVEGVDHETFCASLRGSGYVKVSVSRRTKGQNQVLVATTEDHVETTIDIPHIHPALPSNIHQVFLLAAKVVVRGFRMPELSRELAAKRLVWEWLIEDSRTLLSEPALILGDFNTTPYSDARYCGDCIEAMTQCGWQRASPTSGHSWAGTGVTRELDHIFSSPLLRVGDAAYSWEFEGMAADAASKKVGIPDHAMLSAHIQKV